MHYSLIFLMLFFGGVVTVLNNKWVSKHKNALLGKKVAVFGATGGIGNELCRYILALEGELITVDRNKEKSKRLKENLKKEFENCKIQSLFANLENIDEVDAVCRELESLQADIIIHNAGAYSIPRKVCSTGYDNVFQINFVSPYYITNRLTNYLSSKKGRVVIVGSIAHNYSKTDMEDIDFSTRKKASLVYGNAKRFLMFSMMAFAEKNKDISVAITHPGITFTNITAHYPKWIFAIIKRPMKVIFMPPAKAALSIAEGMFLKTEKYNWIGPGFFNVWGLPTKKALKSCSDDEFERIKNQAENIYLKCFG